METLRRALVCSTLSLLISASAVAQVTYTPGPAIENATVLRSKAITWVHIDESVTCKAYAKDADTRTENCSSTNQYDYIDLPATTWSCSVPTAITTAGPSLTTSFSPVTAGDGDVVVTATIKDKTDYGANDPDNATATRAFKGYKVGCAMNVTATDSSDSATVWETDATTTASITRNCGIAEVHIDNGDGSTNHAFAKYASCEWINKVYPGSAVLDSAGQVKTPIRHDESGEIGGNCWDCELFDAATSIGVELSGGAGFEAGVSISHTCADDESALCGSGIAFSSDALGDFTTAELQLSSELHNAPGPAFVTAAANYAQGADFRSGKDGSSKAKLVVEEKSWIYDTTNEKDHLTDVYWYSTVCGTYKITGKPTYEPGTAPDPDPGY